MKHQKKDRDFENEYYYVVFFKNNTMFPIIKSICDIQNWVPNPSNPIQINFGKEYSERTKFNIHLSMCNIANNIIKSLYISLKRKSIDINLCVDSMYKQMSLYPDCNVFFKANTVLEAHFIYTLCRDIYYEYDIEIEKKDSYYIIVSNII